MRATIACAALLAASPAAAQEPLRAVTFSWVRGDGADRCPSPADMMTAVRARVGRDPFSPAATTSAEASVERVADRWRARLLFRDAQGAVILRRDLDDASPACDTIAVAVAVSVTLALAPTPPRAPLVDPEPARPPAPPPAPPPPPAQRARPRLTLAGEALVGPLPGVAYGVVARIEGSVLPHASLYGSVAFEPEVRTGASGEWAFGMTRASLGACAHGRALAWLTLAGCGGASVGFTHAVTHGPSPLEPGNYPWLAATVDLRIVAHPVGPLLIDVGAATSLAFVRNDFVVTTSGIAPAAVYTQSLLSLAVSLGLGLEL